MKPGTLVVIDFQDHCSAVSGSAELVDCRVVGWLLAEDDKSITVCPWVSKINPEENNDTYALRKHPGMKIRRVYDKR